MGLANSQKWEQKLKILNRRKRREKTSEFKEHLKKLRTKASSSSGYAILKLGAQS